MGSATVVFHQGSVVDDGSEHFHTDTIWFYEYPYPAGYKSYSKTKPIRLEEFKSEQEWWGTEDNDFADRVENEVDFKTKREQAEAAQIASPRCPSRRRPPVLADL